jgi:hypothetical protein
VVLDAQCPVAQGGADPVLLLAEALRPRRVVLGQRDLPVEDDRLADGRCPDLVLSLG